MSKQEDLHLPEKPGKLITKVEYQGKPKSKTKKKKKEKKIQ